MFRRSTGAWLSRAKSIFTYSNFNMQNEWTLPHGVEGGIRKIDDRFIVDVTPDDGSGVRLSLSLSHTLSPLLASCSSTYGLIVTGVCGPITIQLSIRRRPTLALAHTAHLDL